MAALEPEIRAQSLKQDMHGAPAWWMAGARAPLRFGTAAGSPAPALAPGAYVLTGEAGEPCALALADRDIPRRRLCFPLLPGGNAYLVLLREELQDPVLLPLGRPRAAAEVTLARLSPALALAATLHATILNCDPEVRQLDVATLRRIGVRRAAPGLDPWLAWYRSLGELIWLSLEDETPDAPPAHAADETGESGFALAGGELGVHLHLHYPELWPEIERCLLRLPEGFRLVVTTSQPQADTLAARIAASFPGARVQTVVNRGRDVAPFVRLYCEGAFDGLKLVCKIHGKKSVEEGRESYFGRVWRRRMFDDLLGSRQLVSRILERFARDPKLGVVGPGKLRFPNRRFGPDLSVGGNRALIDRMAMHGTGAAASDRVDYFAGSMFWFRPEALQALRNLGITERSFPDEAGQSDGTPAHALERLIPTLAALSGFGIESAP